MGTVHHSPVRKTGYPQRPGKSDERGGACVVVRSRESRLHGEGKQGVDIDLKPEEQSVDSDFQADKAWVLNVQRKLYQWSKANPNEAYRELWNWMTDLHNLRHAWREVASNKGRRTPGIESADFTMTPGEPDA